MIFGTWKTEGRSETLFHQSLEGIPFRETIMKVSDLIKMLQEHDPDRLVVISRDPEGNGFEALGEVEAMAFDQRFGGEVRYEKLTPELEELGYSSEDIARDDGFFTPAVVLWP